MQIITSKKDVGMHCSFYGDCDASSLAHWLVTKRKGRQNRRRVINTIHIGNNLFSRYNRQHFYLLKLMYIIPSVLL